MKTKLFIAVEPTDEDVVVRVWTTRKRWETRIGGENELVDLLGKFKGQYTIKVRSNQPLDRKLMIEASEKARELGHSIAF